MWGRSFFAFVFCSLLLRVLTECSCQHFLVGWKIRRGNFGRLWAIIVEPSTYLFYFAFYMNIKNWILVREHLLAKNARFLLARKCSLVHNIRLIWYNPTDLQHWAKFIEPAFNVTGHSHRGGFEEEKENYQFLVFFHGFVESMTVILVSESEPNWIPWIFWKTSNRNIFLLQCFSK